MAKQRIPLFGSLTNRLSSGAVLDSADQQFINCFPELTVNALSRKGAVKLIKRQGYSSSVALADATFTGNIGYCYWSGTETNVYSVSKASTVRVYDATGAQVGGDLTPNCQFCHSLTETKISNVATLFALVFNGTRMDGWTYTLGGAWARIADADFPPNQATPLRIVGEPVHKDGFTTVMDSNGTMWTSDLNSTTAWTATSFLEAADSPDGGGGVVQINNLIAAFGGKTTQFFQNAGNATGSPFTRVPITINVGTSTLGTNTGYRYIVPVGNDVYFIGLNKEESARHVYKLSGTSATKISDTAVDNFLNDTGFSEGTDGTIIGVVFIGGMTHIVMDGGGTTNGHYAYCIDRNLWWRLSFPTTIYAAAGDAILAGRTVSARSTGYQDLGATLTMTVRTENLDQGTQKRKFFKSAELVCDTQTTSGNISISWSDDDYATFSTARTIDPSTGTRRVTRLGSTKLNNNHKRAWKIEETVNRPFRGTELVLDYDVGEA